MSDMNDSKLTPEREASAPPPYESEENTSSSPNESKQVPDFKPSPPPPPYEAKQSVPAAAKPQVVYVPSNQTFDSEPVVMHCPFCQKLIETKLEYQIGCLSWLGCVACVLLDCTMGCCLIPFCLNSCKDVEHHCPNCKNFLGKYKRIG